jgi:hypothetical protein
MTMSSHITNLSCVWIGSSSQLLNMYVVYVIYVSLEGSNI